MTVKLLRAEAGAGPRGAEVTLPDEQANDLVSRGVARQVNAFAITSSVTSAPPWSPEKFGPEADRATAVAEAVGAAVQAQAEADKAVDRAEEARGKEIGAPAAAAAPLPPGLADPRAGVVGGATEQGGGEPGAASQPSRVAGEAKPARRT
jgi:hypothetical protein